MVAQDSREVSPAEDERAVYLRQAADSMRQGEEERAAQNVAVRPICESGRLDKGQAQATQNPAALTGLMCIQVA